jgi:hypothetical protein
MTFAFAGYTEPQMTVVLLPLLRTESSTLHEMKGSTCTEGTVIVGPKKAQNGLTFYASRKM